MQTHKFNREEFTACQRLIQLGFEEDLDQSGDLTSQAIIPESLQGQAMVVARNDGVLAGLPAVELVFASPTAAATFEPLTEDGAMLHSGGRIATVRGPLRNILAGERLALNFLQRLSGIATLTRRYVDALAGLACRILDTRKTTPGWRFLDKYAVRQGGGHNHRMGLYDGILIKDNHLAALRDEPSPIAAAVQAARRWLPSVPVEIEVDNLDQFDTALALGPDIILLDNMGLGELAEAVARRDAACDETSWVFLEASGGITLANVRAIAETGVDRISVGALTHSAPALDIALDYLE